MDQFFPEISGGLSRRNVIGSEKVGGKAKMARTFSITMASMVGLDLRTRLTSSNMLDAGKRVRICWNSKVFQRCALHS